MPTTAQQMQNLILMEVGEPLTGGPIGPVLPTLWSMFTDKGLLPNGTRLQYLYVLAKAFDIKIGLIMDGAYMPVGQVQHEKLDDKVSGYRQQRDATLEEIVKLEKVAGGLRAPVVGQLTRTAPIQPADSPYTTLGPDPNDRRFRGDPLVPRLGRVG
jgi:hypothetical protein